MVSAGLNKNIMKKFLLNILLACLALAMPALASAEPIKIYLLKSSVQWNPIKLYAWDNNKKALNGSWSGTAMTAVETIDDVDYLVWTAPDGVSPINIIFNNGSAQTGDITGITKTTFYRHNGGANFTTFDPFVLAKPTVSKNGNTVTIKPSADGGNVYYTLDGSEPGKESTLYEGPFTLSADATVKAIQMKEIAKSGVVTFDFVWEYYASVEIEAGIYYPVAAEKVEICATDMPYIPVEGQAKVSGQPDHLYLMGDIDGHIWKTDYVCEGKRYGSCFVFADITFNPEVENVFFNFAEKTGATWEIVNGGTRYGAPSEGVAINEDNALAYKVYSGWDASGAKSWTMPTGTYTLIFDFSTKKLTVTKKPEPAFEDMAVAEGIAFKATAEGAMVYKADVKGSKLAFRTDDVASAVYTVADAGAYVYTGTALAAVKPVEVGMFDAVDGLLSPDVRFVKSVGVTAARLNGEELADDFSLAADAFEANSLVDFAWEADNNQGLTFFGNYTLVNAVETVEISAKIPEGWQGISYRLISKLDENIVADGVFTETKGDYLVLTVPAHLIHSTIIFSNSAVAADVCARVAADATITKELQGKSMYFDNNGEHWGTTEFDPTQTGVDAVAADALPMEYFTLQGVRVANPGSGIYLRRQGTKVVKMIVR